MGCGSSKSIRKQYEAEAAAEEQARKAAEEKRLLEAAAAAEEQKRKEEAAAEKKRREVAEPERCTVELVPSEELQVPSDMYIAVKSLSGLTLHVGVCARQTVRVAKARILQQDSFLADKRFALVLKGQMLEDSAILSEAGVEKGTLLFLVLHAAADAIAVEKPVGGKPAQSAPAPTAESNLTAEAKPAPEIGMAWVGMVHKNHGMAVSADGLTVAHKLSKGYEDWDLARIETPMLPNTGIYSVIVDLTAHGATVPWDDKAMLGVAFEKNFAWNARNAMRSFVSAGTWIHSNSDGGSQVGILGSPSSTFVFAPGPVTMKLDTDRGVLTIYQHEAGPSWVVSGLQGMTLCFGGSLYYSDTSLVITGGKHVGGKPAQSAPAPTAESNLAAEAKPAPEIKVAAETKLSGWHTQTELMAVSTDGFTVAHKGSGFWDVARIETPMLPNTGVYSVIVDLMGWHGEKHATVPWGDKAMLGVALEDFAWAARNPMYSSVSAGTFIHSNSGGGSQFGELGSPSSTFVFAPGPVTMKLDTDRGVLTTYQHEAGPSWVVSGLQGMTLYFTGSLYHGDTSLVVCG